MRIFPSLTGTLLLLSSISAHAFSYDAVYAFGDSLSDNGAAHPGLPAAPYANGRFSNGSVAVEDLAAKLGATLYDYAWGGATTGASNPDLVSYGFGNTGVLSQVNTYLAGNTAADPNGLYFIWAGGNDLLNAALSSTPATIEANLTLAIHDAVINLVTEVSELHAIGAEHFLIPNLTDLGTTPQILTLNLSDPGIKSIATTASQAFDLALAAALPAYVTQFDTYSEQALLQANAAAYGLSNLTAACFDGTSVCSNPDSYLYWDDLHPTKIAHQILANGFYAAVVPLPQTGGLLLAGLGLLGSLKRSRKTH